MSAGANQALDEREWQTRKQRIDPKLKGLDWTVVPFRPGLSLSSLKRHAVTEFPTDNGPADYALVVDGRVIGIIEAKKLSLEPQNVLTQAERYGRGVPAGDFNLKGLRAAGYNPLSQGTFVVLDRWKGRVLRICTDKRVAREVLGPHKGRHTMIELLPEKDAEVA